MDPIVTIGVKAARRAGGLILRYLDRLEQLNVEKKGRRDYVSEIDRMAEEDIIDTIRYSYPTHTILGEESGHHEALEEAQSESASGSDSIEWIIDPLDGTTNFLHGHPHFCVSIAVRVKGTVQHGVIYDPVRDELFTASRSKGAQLDNRRIRVSGKAELSESLIGTGFPFREIEKIDHSMKIFRAVLPKVADIKVSGSAALDLAYVASGRIDAYWEAGLKSWDIAAGSLIVREAGGLVADFNGGQEYLDSGEIVAANPRMFNELLGVIKTRS